MSKGQILSAANTKPLADALRAKLGSLGDVDILLVSSDLENDPRRNSIARRGLDALARDKLVVVQVDDALPPLGLRDVARFCWSPAMADSEERIAAVAEALGVAQMRPPQERIKRPLDLFWVVLGAVVAVMSAVVVWRILAASRPLLLPETEGETRSSMFGATEALPLERAIFWMVGAILAIQAITLLVALVRWLLRSLSARKTVTQAQSPATGGLLFASYSRQDHDKVDAMIGDIERDGLPVWLDRVNISGGTTWPDAIVQAIKGARAVIVFCSSHSFQSDNVLREVNLAAEYKKPILPIVLEPVPMPDSFHYYLATRQIVDASRDPNWRLKVLDSLRHAGQP